MKLEGLNDMVSASEGGNRRESVCFPVERTMLLFMRGDGKWHVALGRRGV